LPTLLSNAQAFTGQNAHLAPADISAPRISTSLFGAQIGPSSTIVNSGKSLASPFAVDGNETKIHGAEVRSDSHPHNDAPHYVLLAKFSAATIRIGPARGRRPKANRLVGPMGPVDSSCGRANTSQQSIISM